jgi:hypothetical protein
MLEASSRLLSDLLQKVNVYMCRIDSPQIHPITDPRLSKSGPDLPQQTSTNVHEQQQLPFQALQQQQQQQPPPGAAAAAVNM